MPRTSRKKPGLLNQAIEVSQLGPLVPRPVAVKFSNLSERTFRRAELGNQLTPIKRNSQSVSYRKEQLLAFLGLVTSRPGSSNLSGAVARPLK